MAMETVKSYDEEKKISGQPKNPEQSDKEGQKEKKMDVIQANLRVISAKELLERAADNYEIVLKNH